MSETTNRQLDLDATLEGWLRDGHRLSADQVVASALTDVKATPQDRASLFAIDATVFRVGLLAAGLAALAIGLGLGLGTRLVVTNPSPGPSDRSSPAMLPAGMILYTNEEDGYELTLPASWTPAEFFTNPPGTMRFGAAHSDNGPSSFGALTVSIGSTDGTVYDCAPSACRPLIATSIDELDAAINNNSGAAAPVTTTNVDVTLDGEPARLSYVSFTGGLIEAGPQFHHVFAIHNGRPIVLSFDKYAYGLGRQSNDIGWVETLIQGFRFLDSAPSPEAGFVVYTVEDGGYEVSVPSAWGLRSDLFGEGAFFGAGDPSLSVAGWGQAWERDYLPVLTISVGDTDGRIRMCQAAGCPSAIDVGTTIEDMDAAITTLAEAGGIPGMAEVRRDLTLDGEPALYVGITSPHGWTATPQFHHVFAIHEGRPVVLAFDHWSARNGEPRVPEFEIIESFRFLDDPTPASTPAAPEPEASVEWQTFAIPEVGLELDAPSDWHLWLRSEVGRETRLTGPTGAIFIRVAEGGAFFACGPTVFCRWAPVSTIDDLVDIVEREYRLETQFGQGTLDIERRPIEIDGVEATFVTIRPSSGILAPRPGLYAMAMHEGQAVLFTWSNWDDAGGLFGEILRSVRFVDR